jgi:PAS domain S-box-containing protein
MGWCLRQLRDARRPARRLRTEQRVLRQSEEQFRSLIANATDVIVIHDADGAIRYQSPAAERVWGYPPGALRRRPPFEMVHLDDLEWALAIFAQALDSPRLSLATELRLRQADRSWGHLEVVVNNLLTDPAVSGILATYRDIARNVAERKAYEDRLAYQA